MNSVVSSSCTIACSELLCVSASRMKALACSRSAMAEFWCTSHLLNIQVELMVKSDNALRNAVEYVHMTIVDCRFRLRNRAILCNLTVSAPIIESATRWSGKYLMPERFDRIYVDIRKVPEDESSTVAMNLTSRFKANVLRFANFFVRLITSRAIFSRKTWLFLNAGMRSKSYARRLRPKRVTQILRTLVVSLVTATLHDPLLLLSTSYFFVVLWKYSGTR